MTLWDAALMIFGVVGLVLILRRALVPSRRLAEPGSERRPAPPVQDPREPTPATLRREEIAARLRTLAGAPTPDIRPMVASCYAVATPPNRAEYTCAVCGEKTIYARDLIRLVEHDLVECRRLVPAIEGVSVRLDESQLCARCSPAVEQPRLAIEVLLAGEERPHRAEGVTPDDLRMIAELLSGKIIHADSVGQDERPLSACLERLEALLGVRRA
jgi:hypothetical protein